MILWSSWRKMNGIKGKNIENKGIQAILEAKLHQQSNLQAKGFGGE